MESNPILNRKSNRLQGYDYSQNGAYFITICAHHHKCIFGKIVNNTMMVNKLGIIAQNEWIKSSEIRTEIEIDESVIMPNHLHGIVFIHHQGDDQQTPGTGCKSKSISALVAGFKSIVTKQINIIRETPMMPVWQRNYHDHIIRSERSLTKLREYIRNNPQSWEKDRFYYT